MSSTAVAGQVGRTVWFRSAGLTVHASTSIHAADAHVVRRGEVLLVTDEVRQANTDRLGDCVFDLDDEQQVARFGRVIFAPGEPPAGYDPIERDSLAWDAGRAQALQAAAALSDPDEQRIAVARVREKWGVPASSRSRTMAEYRAKQ